MEELIKVLMTGGAITTPLVIGGLLYAVRRLDARVEAKDAQLIKMTETTITAVERFSATVSSMEKTIAQLVEKVGK